MGVNTSDTSSPRDASGIGGINNNFDSKNTYGKAGFNIYNVAGANADADASANTSDTSGTKDVGGISGANNNANGKNAYTKADFSTYNIAGANVDTGASDICKMVNLVLTILPD